MDYGYETKKYCIISHTHWDREWYLPLENFRMRLVDLIDNLLDIVEKYPEYRFHLDAQTIVLDDYLEIRPEKQDILKKHIREGRILVGPWYVQNDFHLTSGEATVRNLLIGTDIAERFGGCMQVGYAADQFGLCSQLPQILSRFGLDTCVFGRGFARGDRQFYWEAEDGSKILCEHMFGWYNNAQRFAPDANGALVLARMRGEECALKGGTNSYLLMNGVDHLEAQEDLPEIIKKVQPCLNSDEAFLQDTLPDYMARLKKDIRNRDLKLNTYSGEFRDQGAPNVLSGTLASRVYLKTRNAYIQALLEKQYEPLYTLCNVLGVCDYPSDYSRYMWKTLIQNHPHDSICGCSVDAVHRHMLDRFTRVEENATDLIQRGSQCLMQHLSRDGFDENCYFVMNVNPTMADWNGPVSAGIEIPSDEDRGSFVLSDRKGRNIPFEIESIEKNVVIKSLSPINLPGEITVNRYNVRYIPGTLAGMSLKTLICTPCEGKLEQTPNRRRSAFRMENEFMKVSVNRNGTVDMFSKTNGRTYRNVLLLEDNKDTGTAYNYYENDGSEIITSINAKASVSVVCDTPLCQKRRIAYTLKIDRETGSGTVGVVIILTLNRHSRTLDINIELDNRCVRHRLRVYVPTGIETDENYAGQPFDLIYRNKISKYDDDRTHPDTDFVGIDSPDGTNGLAVFQSGLYEYEHMDGDNDGTLAVTLLRAVQRASGSFEEENTMDQSWITPEGECQGKHQMRMALYPYKGNHTDAATALLSQQFMGRPMTFVQCADYKKFIGGRPFIDNPATPKLFFRPMKNPEAEVPMEFSLFRTEDESIPGAMILSACKGSEANDGTAVLRFWNSTSQDVSFSLRFGRKIIKAETVMLSEKHEADCMIENGKKIRLQAKPKQILTVKITPDGRKNR